MVCGESNEWGSGGLVAQRHHKLCHPFGKQPCH